MQLKQHLIVLVFTILFVNCYGSIYPEGEDKESWDARINTNIDRLHKRNVKLRLLLTDDEFFHWQAGTLRLSVNQTRSPISFGMLKWVLHTERSVILRPCYCFRYRFEGRRNF